MVYHGKYILIFGHWLRQFDIVAFRFIDELEIEVFIYAE